MKQLKVQTDLHCDRCVSEVSPLLDQAANIQSWSINTEQGVKTLSAVGVGIQPGYIQDLLAQKGYSIISKKPVSGFWSDARIWNRASFNTLNCLIGCSIGDFGMVFFLQAYYPGTPILLQMTLAIIAGLITSIVLETILLKSRENFDWALALKTAFGMSFISMVAMEIAMTATDFMFTGGQAAFDQWQYWFALLPALAAGFLTPLPYNYFKLKKFNRSCH